jgi:hypothetical protein
MGGLGLIDPYIHMGVSHIVTLITHQWKRSPTGLLLDITLDGLALEMGLSSPWQQDQLRKGLSYVSVPSWIRDTMQFMVDYRISLHVEEQYFSPNCKNDCTIMEKVVGSVDKVSIMQSIN